MGHCHSAVEKNRLGTLEQGLDRDRFCEWELPPVEWVKLLRNKCVNKQRTKEGNTRDSNISQKAGADF